MGKENWFKIFNKYQSNDVSITKSPSKVYPNLTLSYNICYIYTLSLSSQIVLKIKLCLAIMKIFFFIAQNWLETNYENC